VNTELETTSKEAVAAKFGALFRHLPGMTEENEETLSNDTQASMKKMH
jgi:hypothetical protein